MIYYHAINTPQSDDVPIFSIPDHPDHMPGAEVSEDGKYLIMTVSASCDPENKVYIFELESGKKLEAMPKFTTIVNKFEAHYSYITNDGQIFWFETTLGAPKNRVVKYDVGSPLLVSFNSSKGFVEVIPESDDVISFLTVVNHDKLIVVRLKDVKHVGTIYSLHSGVEIGSLDIPVGSIVSALSGRRLKTN